MYGLGGPFAAAFHLGVHALFKSALFLSAGAVQHAADTLDMRRLGGLWRTMPLSALTFTLAGLTLAGVPPFGAFWSEEAILGTAVQNGWPVGAFMLLLIFLAGMYISRAGVATFWPRSENAQAHEVGTLMAWPGLILAVAALFGGLLGEALRGLLPFTPSPEVTLGWRISAISASVLGLAWGGVRAVRLGASPALGDWPRALGTALEGLTMGTARGTWALSLGVAVGLEAGPDMTAAGAVYRSQGQMGEAQSRQFSGLEGWLGHLRAGRRRLHPVGREPERPRRGSRFRSGSRQPGPKSGQPGRPATRPGNRKNLPLHPDSLRLGAGHGAGSGAVAMNINHRGDSMLHMLKTRPC